MKILGLISSLTDPASRARIIQYKDHFKESGHTLTPRYFTPIKDADPQNWAYHVKKITGINEWRSLNLLKAAGRIPLLFSQSGYDIIWQNRLLHPHHFFWETKLLKPVVFDFDDAIWLSEGKKQVIKKIELSSMVFAGNEYLAEFAKKINNNTHVIPTTINTNLLYPQNILQPHFTIGWIGTETNFEYLENIYQPLRDFLGANKDSRLMIVSSHLPDFIKLNTNQLIFKQWKVEKENEYINEFSVGIMPLADTEWTRGKCSYKLLQYLACGIPAIASPIGTNIKIIKESNAGIAASSSEEWLAALLKIKNEKKLNNLWGTNGRKFIEEKFCSLKWSDTIIKLIKTVS